ncbi:MAG: SAM-dependent methyltransferase [Nitrospiraceae bacterium]|nr:SAM-dependent methyltransferase [Nitrospiraceae bacterium]
MSFTLDTVVPWGRSYEEYVSMFSLDGRDLRSSIIGCADGPSGFNAELTGRGGKIISVDPVYRFTKEEISKRIGETYEEILAQTLKNKHEFVWTGIRSVDELGRTRMSAMRAFLSDFENGLREGRYLAESLPSLSFADGQYALALCSHFLFLYSDQLSLAFHIAAISEMCRVAREVRIFPLLKLGAEPSPYVEPVVRTVTDKGFRAEIIRVDYEFQRGGNMMLRIRRPDVVKWQDR